MSAPTTVFNFTDHVRRICEHMTIALPELAHIDLGQVAISFAQARSRVAHGIQATLTPMRFESGALISLHRGRRYTVQRLYDRTTGREILYILTIYVPRFFCHPLREKLATIVHELWHISPEFNGDLRRFAGRCYAHGRSQKEYDAEVDQITAAWLALNPPEELLAPLRLTFGELQQRHGQIVGTKIPKPKLIPVKS